MTLIILHIMLSNTFDLYFMTYKMRGHTLVVRLYVVTYPWQTLLAGGGRVPKPPTMPKSTLY